MKILCVDDDEGLQYLLRSALETLDYQVTICLDSEEALPLLQTTKFDVVILDQEMPKKSGLEIVKLAQSLPEKPPIIMLTGAGNEVIAVEAMRLGASDYVVKDINLVYLKILPSVIQQVVQERELTQRQQAAERAAQVEKERSRLLAQFIRDASHEFRIPLTIIQSSGELLGRMVGEPREQEYVNRILQQCQRIVSLVDHLIQLSRLENTAALQLKAVSLTTLLQEALARKSRLLVEKNIDVQLDLGTEAVPVLADADELVDAFVELIDNARLACKPGDTLHVALAVDQGMAKVIVRDTGIGMTETQLLHIFERFYRVDEAHTTPGFGLGLPIVKRIFDLHQGTVCITSEAGQGTTVITTLPLCEQ